MFKCVLFMVPLFLAAPFATCENNVSTGAIPIPDDSYCPLMEKWMRSVIYPSDWCIFLVLEHMDCPLYVTDNTMVTVSLEKMFDGFVAKAQDKFYCDKSLALFENWKTFRDYISNRNLTKKFNPYNRLAVFSRINSTQDGNIFTEAHLRQIYLGALHVYYGRLITENAFELQDVLTNDRIQFSGRTGLETVIRSIRNFLIHPLFDTKASQNEVNVSLYHCDPFVIRLNEEQNIKR